MTINTAIEKVDSLRPSAYSPIGKGGFDECAARGISSGASGHAALSMTKVR